ncbi:hypothetical protein, partial [Flavobacterium aurantiibacter]
VHPFTFHVPGLTHNSLEPERVEGNIVYIVKNMAQHCAPVLSSEKLGTTATTVRAPVRSFKEHFCALNPQKPMLAYGVNPKNFNIRFEIKYFRNS